MTTGTVSVFKLTAHALALLVVGLAGCGDLAEEEAAGTEPVAQGAITLPACKDSEVCGADKGCNTACSVTDSQGAYGTTCSIYLHGNCDGNGGLTLPGSGGPSGGGGGGDGDGPQEPNYCANPGPYEVIFWQDANFRGRCVYRSAGGNVNGRRTDYYAPWIESTGFYFFPNDKLSSVAVGSRVRLEIFNNRDFGQSFGTWWPGSRIDYVGNYANDKMSSFKIYVAN